ncbi:MAG: DMT family transporter [Lachnospiraceae bacterium]|nr:DMT family transporter [Lachnospiraceae bacterium]
MSEKKTIWAETPFVILIAFICCFLWGSAFPSIKSGYRIFQIPSSDTASVLVFAGVRFFLAGCMVIVAGSFIKKKPLIVRPGGIPCILALCAFQTFGQYYFFYIGLAHASGVSSSVIEASGTFMTILIAALIFRTERLSPRKIAGTVIGFAGVMLIQINGIHQAFSFTLMGEGFILISALLGAFSSSFIKLFSKKYDTVALCGYQFMAGGLLLFITGCLSGGHLSVARAGAPGIMLIIYMAFISACAYTLWGILLSHNPVSRIAVFGFMNPVIGVVLSAIILGEYDQAIRLQSLVALLLVSLGIIVVNLTGKEKDHVLT